MNKSKNIPENDKERDPFLEEAMEGWEQFPKARMKWFSTKARFSIFIFGKSWAWLPAGSKWLIGSIGAAATVSVITVSTLLFQNKPDQMYMQQANNETPEQILQEPGASEEANSDDTILLSNQEEYSEAEGTKDFNETNLTSDREETSVDNRSTNTRMTPVTNSSISSNQYEYYTTTGSADLDDESYVNKIDSKKTERLSTPKQDRQVAALPWLWVHNYKIVDYDMLRTDLDAPSVAMDKSLSPRYASELEKEKGGLNDQVITIDTIPYKQYLASALLMIKQQNYPEAERQLKVLENMYPKDENIIFYTGYMYYERGSFAMAIPYFEKAMKSPLMAYTTDAEWLIANSLLNMGNTKEACSIFRLISSRNNFYSKDARKLLKLHDHE